MGCMDCDVFSNRLKVVTAPTHCGGEKVGGTDPGGDIGAIEHSSQSGQGGGDAENFSGRFQADFVPLTSSDREDCRREQRSDRQIP
jgi:hypothetical protein